MGKKGMVAYLVRLFLERALGLALFLLGSGWALGPRGMLWFAAYFAAIGTVIWLYHAAPETMAARLAIADSKDVTPSWDKALLAVFWLLGYFVVYWVAGMTCSPSLAIDALPSWVSLCTCSPLYLQHGLCLRTAMQRPSPAYRMIVASAYAVRAPTPTSGIPCTLQSSCGARLWSWCSPAYGWPWCQVPSRW